MPSYQIVIARYNESLKWTEKMNQEHLVIYNKGNDFIDKAIVRPNIGREQESFLYHIIHHYDNLPDYICFVQGNPFDHMQNITPDNFQSRIDQLLGGFGSVMQPLFTHPHHEKHGYYPGLCTKEYFSLFFQGPVPDHSIFAAGAQYIVPKANILHRSRQFYLNLHAMISQSELDLMEAHYHKRQNIDLNAIDGWCLERLLQHVFSMDIPSSEFMEIPKTISKLLSL